MARRVHKRGKRNRVLVSQGLHPQYRRVIRTYLRGLDSGDDYAEIPVGSDGALSLEMRFLDEDRPEGTRGLPRVRLH